MYNGFIDFTDNKNPETLKTEVAFYNKVILISSAATWFYTVYFQVIEPEIIKEQLISMKFNDVKYYVKQFLIYKSCLDNVNIKYKINP